MLTICLVYCVRLERGVDSDRILMAILYCTIEHYRVDSGGYRAQYKGGVAMVQWVLYWLQSAILQRRVLLMRGDYEDPGLCILRV